MSRMNLMAVAISFVGVFAAGRSDAAAGAESVARHSATAYEWHTIVAAPGQLDALHVRLRDGVLPALGNHGMECVGVFTPAGENTEGLVHLLVSSSENGGRPTAAELLASVGEWQALLAGSDGKPALATPRSMQRLRTTAWSPLPAAGPQATTRMFELRTYTSPDAAKREALLRRFEGHTMKLFAKHGMTNVIYWTPDGGPDADTKLVYLLAHDSTDAAKESFAAFRQDPDWIAAKTASETAAGGSLTTKDKGVVSEFLSPAAYSPLR
jgi:hypothetical protein